MKKILLLVVSFIGLFSARADAALTRVLASGGTNICANLAVTGTTPAYTTLGSMIVRESLPGDITFGIRTLVLATPTGWQFNALGTPAVTFAAGRDIVFANIGGITATTCTINIGVFGTAQLDTFTISGLQVQALTTGAAAGNITASSATGFTGITTGVSSFASLSLTPSLVPSVTIAASPTGAICSGTNVTFTGTPVNGGTPTYQWFINGTPVAGATNSTFASSTLTAGNNVRLLMTPTGCVTLTSAPSNIITMTVTPTPAAVTVATAGTYCNNTTLVATLAGPGVVYYHAATANSTSTTTPTTSQLITATGTNTFYFRARNGACWGPDGSAKVTINTAPTAMSISPSATGSLCLGDNSTFIATATAPNVEVFQEDFNAGAGAWTIASTSGTAASDWQVRNAPGWASAVAGDGSPYMQAAADATGSGVTTTTTVTSPAFSLVGYTAASLSFNQYFQTYVADITVRVEYSTDGTTWTPFIDQLGSTTGFFNWVSTTPNTTVAIPAGAIGQPNVQLRWNYSSVWGWYWAIDNISVKATPTLSFTWAGIAGATGLSCTTCDTVTVTPATAGVNTYSVVSSVSGCATSANLTLTVNSLPATFNVTGGGNYCFGGTGVNVGLFGSEVGVDYQLFNGAATVGATIPGTGSALDFGPQTAAGTYTVLGTSGSTTCSVPMTDSAVVVIDTLPSPITGPSSVCVGSVVTLTDATPGGTWSSSDAATADVIATTGDVSGIAFGVADITYTAATGCFITTSMTVNSTPFIAPITGITNLCAGSSTTLSSATTGGTWTSDDMMVATIDAASGLVNGITPGTTTISYNVTDGFGCSGSVSIVDTVVSAGSASILPAGMYVTMCHGNPANLVATILAGAAYQWSMAGTPIAGATNNNYIATAPGVYTLDISLGTCALTLTKTVLADPVAVISYNVTGNYLYTSTFNTYQWFMNGAAIPGATSSILLDPAAGDYTVVVTDVTGCPDTSAIYTRVPTGINTAVNTTSVKIFPNPSTSVIHIDAPVKVSASVLTPDGRVVIAAGQAVNSINVQPLANGVYMLLIFDENKTLLKTERFTKIN